MKTQLLTIRNLISRSLGIGLLSLGLGTTVVHSQEISATSYPMTLGTGRVLATVPVVNTQHIASNNDDTPGPLNPFGSGFTFTYGGVKYNSLSVSPDGYFRLGTAASAQFTNDLASTTNTPIIAPFWDDVASGTNGQVRGFLTGTAPNRIYVIDWLVTIPRNTAGVATGNFQCWLYENGGKIEFIYGAGILAGQSYSVGHALTSALTTRISTATINTPFTTSTNAYVSATPNNTNGAAIASGSAITYTPPVPSAAPSAINFTGVTSSNITVNWNDNSTTETFYLIQRSIDGGVNYVTLATLPSNTVTYNATGLLPGQSYTFKVIAATEGSIDSSIVGSQTTLAPTAVLSTGVGGNWSNTATWAGGVLPTMNDSVVIVTGANVIVDGTAGTCFNLTVNGTLNYDLTTLATLSVINNVVVNTGGTFDAGAGTLTTHNLRIGGTAPTNLGSGSLTVNGTFDMNTTAGVTVTFFGASNAVVNGSGAIDFRTVTLNKGALAHNAGAPTLDIQTTFTVQGANTIGLIGTHTAGILKISGSFTQNNPVYTAAAYTIPLNGGLWLNNPNFTVDAQNGNPTVNGLLRVSNGTYNTGTTNAALLSFGVGSAFTVDGGTVNASSRINTANAMTFNMSSGVINVAVIGNSTSAAASFGITSATSVFNISGGSINLVNRNTGATILDYHAGPFAAGNSTITGGVLNVGTAATATNYDFRIRGNVPNLVLDNTTNTKSVILSAQLNTFGDIIVPVGDTLNMNGQIILHQGDTLKNDGYINGKGAARLVFGVATTNYTQRYFGTGLDSLFSIETQKPLGTTIIDKPIFTQRVIFFDSMGFVNSNNINLGYNSLPVTVQYGQAAGTRPAGNFDIAPTFNLGTGAYSILYVQEPTARTTGVEIPLSRSIRSLTINNTNGVVLAGGALTLEYGGVLTLTNGKLTTTSTNILNVQDSVVAAVVGGNATSYVNGPMTRQLPSALFMPRTYSFPVGKATFGSLDLLNPGTSSGGPVTVRVEQFNAPTGGTLGAGANSIDTVYWRVEPIAGLTNIDSTTIRVNASGLTGINRVLYSATQTGTYNISSTGPLSTTQIKTNTLIGGAAVDGYFALGTQIIPMTGTYLVGASQTAPNYKNLTEVVADLGSKQLQGNVVFELQADYTSSTETFPLIFINPAKNNFNHTVTIRPAAGTTDSIVGSFNGPLIRLDGIRGFILDGRQGGTGTPNSIIVRNNNTGASAAAVTFVNDAVRDTLKHVVLWGASTTATSGVVNFSTGLVTGNDSNAIMHSDIGGDTITSPATLVQALGSTDLLAKFNDYNEISNCNLYNFWNATGEANAFKVSNGNNNWTITNNSIYQMSIAGRTSTSGYYSFNLNGGNLNALNNITITNNYIGGSLPMCGGTPWKQNSSAATLFSYFNMGNLAMSNVSKNTFANFDIVTTSTSTTGAGAFNAIQFINGMMNIDSNIIGSMTDTSSIRLRTGSGGTTLLISSTASNTPGVYSIKGNQIGGITLNGGGTVSNSINCINITSAGATIRYNINGNTIGNNLPNNIIAAASSSTTAQSIRGINNTSSAALAITNNTIHNLTNLVTGTSTASVVIGIISTNGIDTITMNTIDSLTSASPSASTGLTAVVSGIAFSSTASGSLISQNTVYALKSTAPTQGISINGIAHTGNSVNAMYSRNFIHSFSSVSTATTARHNGIFHTSGNNTIANNMIRLGIDETGTGIATNTIITGITKTGGNTHVYYNTIYIGGSSVTGTGAANSVAFLKTNSANDTIANNVFANERSNATTGGNHYAIQLSNNANSVCNYNLLFANGTGGFVGGFGAGNSPSMGDWIIASGGDANSVSGNPGFVNPTSATPNLKVSGTTLIEGIGTAGLSLTLPLITTDFEGDNRATNTPVDLGADAGLYTPMDLTPPGISFTALPNDTVRSTIILNNYFNIMDNSGVNITGVNAPRIYYKKKSDNNVFLGNTSADNGWKYVTISNATNPYSLTINLSIINGGSVSIGDTIQYFVVAQDLATTPNVGAVPSSGFSATSVSSVTSAPTNPSFFAIIPYPLAGTYTVGTSVPADYPTITAAITALNDLGVKAPVTFLLIDASYTTPAETFPYVISSYRGASAANPVTIKPSPTVTPTISGSSATAIFRLNGASNVTIDGSNTVNGTTRDLTINNTSTSAGTAVIWNSSLGLGQGSARNTFKNCKLYNGSTSVANYGVFVGGATIGSGGADNDFVTIQNDTISSAAISIAAIGTTAVSAGAIDSLSIIGNAVTYNGTAATIGIQVGNALNASVSNNLIDVQTSTTLIVGISLESGFLSSTVTRNNIVKVNTTNTGGYAGRGITVGTDNANSNITIANNFISGVNGSNWNTFGNSSTMGIGIGLIGASGSLTTVAGGINLYHNTVNIYGSMSSGSTTANTAALYIGSAATNLNIRNNIFINTQTATTATQSNYAVYSAAPVTAFTSLDYNNYYVFNSFNAASAKIGWLGANLVTLADWQVATGKDLSSINDSTNFLSNSDLHITGSTLGNLSYKGSPIAGITTDFDLDIRVALYPYIGADESLTNPLPVELSSFNATAKSSDVLLNWTSVSELNNKGFEVERSVDGRNFTYAAFVKGAGTTSNTVNYTLTDADAFNIAGSNILYYRLKQVDFDGKFEYSSIVKVSKDEVEMTALSAYPNPYSTDFNISLTANHNGKADFEIVDLQGKTVARQTADVVSGTNVIPVTESVKLNPGVYFIRITVNKETQFLKLIRN